MIASGVNPRRLTFQSSSAAERPSLISSPSLWSGRRNPVGAMDHHHGHSRLARLARSTETASEPYDLPALSCGGLRGQPLELAGEVLMDDEDIHGTPTGSGVAGRDFAGHLTFGRETLLQPVLR